jgi:hypothetical protein
MTPNLRLANDAVVHHRDPDMVWMATLCGLRRTSEDRAAHRLTQTADAVDCMTCLVLKAQRPP